MGEPNSQSDHGRRVRTEQIRRPEVALQAIKRFVAALLGNQERIDSRNAGFRDHSRPQRVGPERGLRVGGVLLQGGTIFIEPSRLSRGRSPP